MTGPYHIREAIYAGQDICASQGHPQARWVCQVAARNGARSFGYRCDTCDRYVTQERYGDKGARGVWVKPEFLAAIGVPPESVPVLSRDLEFRRCQKCRQTAQCEDHHWAPQAIFDDADEWPIGPLCRPCHQRYGQVLEAYIQRRVAVALGKAA